MKKKQLKKLARIAADWRKDFNAINLPHPAFLNFEGLDDIFIFLYDAASKVEFPVHPEITAEARDVVKILSGETFDFDDLDMFHKYLEKFCNK